MTKQAMQQLAAALVLVCIALPTQALTMLPSDFSALCSKAQWIVLAKVVKEELVPPTDGHSAPAMCYTLQPEAQWDNKTALVAPRLCYLGDLVSEHQLRVVGLHYPKVGETGIFMIQQPNSTSVVSPLTGWNQGQFLVRTTRHGRQVLTANGVGVCGVDASQRAPGWDGSVANGLRLDSQARPCTPVNVENFERMVRQCAR